MRALLGTDPHFCEVVVLKLITKPYTPNPREKLRDALGLPWREAGPPNHHDDKVDSDQ